MMPQLDSASYLSQAFWLIVCFCLLWMLVSTFITPKLTDIIEQRKRKINDYIQKAERLNNQAKETLVRYDNIISQAQHQADDNLLLGKQKIKMQLDKTWQKMNSELLQEISEHRKNLIKEQKQTAKQIDTLAQEMALTIVHKLGFSKINAQDIALASRQDKDDG